MAKNIVTQVNVAYERKNFDDVEAVVKTKIMDMCLKNIRF